MKFILEKTDLQTNARAGIIETAHGNITTPVFMPVGTVGAVKAVHARELKNDIHAQIILGNTYHLYLRPGVDVIHQAGGIQKFNAWNKPMLTDSGGFQVFSLGDNRKIKEEGVMFRSHIDGSKHLFTPENIVDIQRKIGADIIMAFDECTPYPCTYEYAENSAHRTHRWLQRCLKRMNETDPLYGYSQSLFPIVQGSVYKDLRKESCLAVAECHCEGNAIGGVSVGEPTEDMYEITELCCSLLPKEKPRYLMGVGTPTNLLECIGMGIDMMDCVMPTRNGRNGMLFTTEGIINIKNRKWQNDFTALDPALTSFVDAEYSKAYLRHLFISNELLGFQIASIHNLSFYIWLVNSAREHILSGDFHTWKTQMIKKISQRL